MRLYKDLFSGDDLFTDTYKMKEIDGIFYEVEGKLVKESTVVSEASIGGNKSAEDTGLDDCEDSVQSGCNIVIANRLREITITKKDYQKHIKTYVKKILDWLEKEKPDAVDNLKTKAPAGVKKILSKFNEWQFFIGETTDNVDAADGMIALMDFREDGVTPYMLFFKDGLIEEKL